MTTVSGNLYGKKTSTVIENSSTSIGNTTEEVRQMFSSTKNLRLLENPRLSNTNS